ncbi:MAG: hypothetical protein HY059_16230 [Proteobacteria bacterium]|nr:hypothetical protein [Pseudomonadota bacterium]
MVTSANVILLPPPGARRPDGARVEEGTDRRRGASRTAAQAGTAASYTPFVPTGRTGRDAGSASGPSRGGKRSFADELVGETGRASGELAFAVQRIAQERLGAGAHFEDWPTALAAYGRAADTAAQPAGFAA